MSEIAYYRVSTGGQTIDAQRSALSSLSQRPFDREFVDQGISGTTLAHKRPGFAALLGYVRSGDALHVFAIDRLGRDAMDIQSTVRLLMEKGVVLEVRGLGRIAPGVGTLIVAVLAQIAEMERAAIAERTGAGLAMAKESLAATGRTHRGKISLGRPPKLDAAQVHAWRVAHNASAAKTADQFGINVSTVKRYSASQVAAPKRAGWLDDRRSRDDMLGQAVPVSIATSGTINHDAAIPDDASRAVDIGLPGAPVAVGADEDGGKPVVSVPASDDVAKPFVGELDVPLPLGLDERAPVACCEGRAQLGQNPTSINGGDIEPRRTVTLTHSRENGGRVRKGRDGVDPIGRVGSVDYEPMLPFDNAQGRFGDERGR